MSNASLLQLVATGDIDKYFTDNPQITLFKNEYRCYYNQSKYRRLVQAPLQHR